MIKLNKTETLGCQTLSITQFEGSDASSTSANVRMNKLNLIVLKRHHPFQRSLYYLFFEKNQKNKIKSMMISPDGEKKTAATGRFKRNKNFCII